MKNNLTRKITGDGSPTLYHAELNEHYHSTHGAYSESMHVFINSGLNAVGTNLEKVKVLEIGFGTGLNAWLAAMWAEETHTEVHYLGIEYYPLAKSILDQLKFPKIQETKQGIKTWKEIHTASWGSSSQIHDFFTLSKQPLDWTNDELPDNVDVIFYDAFAPNKQPEMWTPSLFKKSFQLLTNGGVWVSYTAKGSIRRSLQDAGFQVEKIPGPPGKREMLRAWKN